MAKAIRGEAGSGSTLAYIVPRDQLLRLETLYFEVTCDGTAGIHKARVVFNDSQIGQITAIMRDLNEGGASEFLTYTYGIGLSGSACVTVSGWEMTDALPDTFLAPETQIQVEMVNDSGALIGGDAIENVVLYGDLIPVAGAIKDEPLLPGLLPGSSGAVTV